MKKSITLLVCSAFFTLGLSAQPCAATAAVGSASNALTNARNATNAVTVDNDLNTVLFVHRNNAGMFGGHSGQLRYDISTDGGATWTYNQGVLNPLSVNGTNGARYPQVAIYNPTGNTNPANAYLTYMGATVAATFNGLVSGVRQLNGSGTTETYNQPASTQTLIPNSMVKGAPGIFWAIDAVYNGTTTTGFRVYKGVWNGSNDVVWSTSSTLNPAFNTAYSGVPQVGDFHIAFDPTGQIGWISILTHISPGPSAYSFYPVFYKTTDGGNTWSGPIQIDLSAFSCITAGIDPGNFATTGFESDLTVDVNGEPHLLTSVCNGNNAYAVFFTSWHHMFDITCHAGMWNAMDVANVNAGRGTWGTSPNAVTMDNQPMISRSPDGRKIFFQWSDNVTYTLGQANQSPNLFSRGYDVTTGMWTNAHDFTSCNAGINGTIILPKIASEVLVPAAGQYKIAGVYTLFTANDPINMANFNFLNNLVWTDADFTIPQPTVTVTIPQGNTWLLCPGSTLGIATGATYSQVLWSNGATTDLTVVNAPGVYSVVVRSGCVLGVDTINVIGLTAVASASSSSICVGDSSLLTVSGNALSYVWNPGNISNDSMMVMPSATTTYTLTASGDGGCTYNQTITVIVNTPPVVTAAVSAGTVCEGDSTQISASGASTYDWQPGSLNGSPIMVAPATNITYTVTGTDANGCMDIDSVSVAVNARPVLSVSASSTVICAGDSTSVSASGASTFDWQPGSLSGSPVTVTPATSTTYTVTGTDVNGCTNTDSVGITVNLLPVVTMTSPIPVACLDDGSIALSGSGSPIGGIYSGTGVTDSSFIPMNAGVGIFAITYTYIDVNGCTANATDSMMVDPCLSTADSPLTSSLSVYPNPFSGVITLESFTHADGEVVVHSVIGQEIMTAKFINGKLVIDTQSWTAGIYLFTVTTTEGQETVRLVKY